MTKPRARTLRRVSALCACLPLLAACAGDAANACGQSAALYHADEDRNGFDLNADEAQAIGVISNAGQTDFCTGILVGDGIVLSARHCIPSRAERAQLGPGAALQFRLGPDALSPDVVFTTRKVSTHPSLDLALIELDEPTRDFARPVPISTQSPDQSWLGTELVMSGFGQTEDGSIGRRMFLREEVVAVASESLTVSGGGESGACVGDSGGPILITGPNGSPNALGVLSKGSASCLGIDVYVRLDAALKWLSSGHAEIDGQPPACAAE